jgi:murein DD-endopeptidase MepM/ murein hydrolase activator NlpD
VNRMILRKGVPIAACASTLLAGAALHAGGAAADGGVTPEGKSGGAGSGKSAVFPIRGKHTYGDGLGAGRNHQGQDVMAKCGTRLVAPRAGKVRNVDYQASGAGNYVVIRGKGGKRFDYVLMHMLRKPSVREGERVRAGEKLGKVGSTGRSTACHLHFEMWTQPGWYRGGDIENPKPYLKRWDRKS